MTKTYKCPDPSCDFAAASLRDVARHLSTSKHQGEVGESQFEKHVCEVDGCQYSTYRSDNFTRHQLKRHVGAAAARPWIGRP